MPTRSTPEAAKDVLVGCQSELFLMHRRWLNERVLDEEQLEQCHARAAVAMHHFYCDRIPSYARLANEYGLIGCRDANSIRAEMLSTELLFKSYGADLLDAARFEDMTDWIGDIGTQRVGFDHREIRTTDEWLAALARHGVFVTCSGGTSGVLSFVPRDLATLETAGAFAEASLDAWFEPTGLGLIDYHAILLTFKGGRQGLAGFAGGIGAQSKTATFLHDRPLDVDALRRGRHLTNSRPQAIERILTVMRAHSTAGAPVLIVGTPFDVLDVCRSLVQRGERIALTGQSGLMLGGGWKSFSGEAVPMDDLMDLVEDRLGLPRTSVDEAYSMIECNAALHLCSHGRYHIPPQIWPLIVDDGLRPQPIPGRGRYAFCDPLATGHAGFIATADEVVLKSEPCACRRPGFTIVGPIERIAEAERRGCAALLQNA